MKIPSIRVGLRIALLYALLGGIWILLSERLLEGIATNTYTLIKLQIYKDWIFVAFGALLIFSLVRHELTIHKVAENGSSKSEGRVHELEDRARELEEKYRKLIERLPMVVYTTEMGAVGFYQYVSPQIESLLGFTPEEWMADPDLWYQQVHPDDRDHQVALEEQAYIHNELIDSEYRIMRRDGQQIWLRDTGHILPPHANGRPIVEGVLVDITERKYAEEALRESEEKYRLILENSMDAILLTAPDGRILSANQAACRMFEYNETELLAAGRNLVVDVTDPRLPVALAERERTGMFRGELTLIRNGGKKFPAEVSTVVFTDRNGKSMTSMIIQDITESKQANEALRESEEKYRNLVEQLPAVVYVDLLDGKGTNLFISSKIETIFGVSEKEWLEGDLSVWADRIYPEDRQRVVDAYLQLSEIGQQYNEEYRIIALDGRLLWIHDKGDVLKNNTGDLILHGVMFDITALKQGETKREELLHVLEASLNEIYTFDPDTLKFEYVNRGALHNLGYSFEQLKTMTPLDIKPEFTETAFRELIAPMIQQEQEKTIFQTIHQRSNGSLYPVEVHLQLVENSDRRVFLAIILDITERKRAEEKIRQQIRRLNGLHTIDIAISSSFELKATLDIVLKQTMSMLNIEACAILLCNTRTQILEYAASRGFHSKALQHTNLRVGHGFAGQVVLKRKTMHIPNLLETSGTLSESLQLSNEKFADYYGTPLIVKGEVKGVLEIYHHSFINPDPEWLAFLETLATQAAIAIDNTQLFESLQRSNFDLVLAYDATIEGWSRAMDLRDKETEGHTQRVTNLTVKLAMQMGISDAEILHIRRGALLHDIGKMGVPDRILHKPDKLSTEEWNIMRKHTLYANDMLSPIAYLKPALDIPLNHHEKWDGTGYPYQLQGEQIPLAARIFTVVDVWDALTSDRPYRKAWTKEKTIDYIKEESGKHFDPQVVDVFLSVIT